MVSILSERQYTEKDAIYSGLKSMMVSGSAGLIFSAVQNAIMKDPGTMKNAIKRASGTVGTFAIVGGLFSFTQAFVSNLRRKDDSLNPFIGGLVSGSIGAIRARSFSAMAGYGLGFACILGFFDWCGGTLNGLYRDFYGEDTGKLKETLFKTEYRRPRSEIVKAIGGGRGV
ncbi:uncharacterized protein T551_02362 [Pneumocystis jirovecii RU7]|uniref:Uncharacterized protein n=1 Tax=Pneumocystis jirovecii (strain RU7) TaxID=1408657 RepID=A0A0W4ZL63_PNEJ7|nr:uncharacterized protein T551_02362 [Pneumocystis jirovecii RU7]KTW29088.1 hypothetical protein T551_02362 [Pneumocystis jirovecii RU7]